jgi:hypothetical protein
MVGQFRDSGDKEADGWFPKDLGGEVGSVGRGLACLFAVRVVREDERDGPGEMEPGRGKLRMAGVERVGG